MKYYVIRKSKKSNTVRTWGFPFDSISDAQAFVEKHGRLSPLTKVNDFLYENHVASYIIATEPDGKFVYA